MKTKSIIVNAALGLVFAAAFAVTASAAGPNLIPNPSLETASSDPSLPLSWFKGGSGSNTRTLSYLTAGHTGTRSVKASIKNYVSGNAKWYFQPVTVAGGQTYAFSDWYLSNIPSTVGLRYQLNDGTYRYPLLTRLPASSSWKQTQQTFTVPTNYGSPVSKVTVFHSIDQVGYVSTDDFSLQLQDACTADTWSCTAWSACSSGGSQSRTCTRTFDCPGVVTPSPSTTQSCTPPPPPRANRYVALVSPTNGESFSLPLNLRFVAMGADGNVFINSPVEGHGHNADKLEFYIDTTLLFSQNGTDAEYGIFKGFANGISVAPGPHQVWARAYYVNPAQVLDSPRFDITVNAQPAYAQTVNLTQDVVLSGSQSYALSGTAGGRIRLNGNGFRIRSTGTSGSLTLRFVDVYDLGSRTNTGSPGIDVVTTGGATIEDSIFDFSDPMAIVLDGAAPASIRRNLFRSNMRMPIGQQPFQPDTYRVIQFNGGSTAPKVFAGNNIAAGPVAFDQTDNWTIGGTTNADSNILVGARTAFELDRSTTILIEGNYVHHVYYGDWSQGQLLEVGGTVPITVQHNVLQGSSWPVRGIGGEFSYNLVLNAGHEWLWPDTHARVNHNLFIGGDNDVGGITEFYANNDIRIINNTFDGQLGTLMSAAINWKMGAGTLRSNSFTRVPASSDAAVVTSSGTTLDADYSAFSDAQLKNYSDNRTPAHDLSGGAQLDFRLAGPLPSVPFDGDEVAVWKRQLSVGSVLAGYRARYTPAQGSPLIDAGDPAGGAGNDVGAIGAGTVNALDKFGSFGQPGWTPPPTPPAP